MSETTKEAQHKNIAYKNSLEEIGCLIKSSIPLIYILTHEERRFVKALETEIINPTKRQIYAWSSYKGLVKWQEWDNVARAKGEMDGTWAAPKCLETIAQIPIPSDKRGIVFCLLDFNQMLAQSIPRQLKDMLENLDRKTIIIVSGQLAYGPGLQKNGLEPTLEKEIHVVEYELPSRLEHEQYLDGTIGSMKAALEDPNVKRKANNTKRKIDYSKEEIWEFSRALQGLTSQEANAAVMSSLVHLDEINFDKLLLEKKQIIKKSDILEYIDVKPSIDDVGGLDLAKEYCKYYSDQFSPEAEEFGVEPVRGILFIGIAGTGKSLICKAISNIWKLPLLRLDIGKVMGGIVGQSESRIRESISQAKAVAPCTLWIDEIEKALGGVKSSNQSDSGTLSRVFGTLLTAMEEGLKGVIFLATANDISQLPPELIRRFNEVFFVDLPQPEEREEIFAIHLRKRKRDPGKVKMKTLVAASHLYTGSEIEKAVKEGLARSWRDGKRELRTEDILGALKDTKPLSTVMAEKISEMRTWARNRARYASSYAQEAQASGAQVVTSSSGNKLKVG